MLDLQWLRHQRRGLRAGGKRGHAHSGSNGEFQKMAAFHDIFPLSCVSSDAGEILIGPR
jgi:hypothetical protein